MRLSKLILLAFCTSLLASCSTFDLSFDEEEVQVEETVEVLYNRAANALDSEEYADATKYFEEVERQHPYSQWSTQAQLMAAYASYRDQRYDEAIFSLDRFIELHPGSDKIDYAYYLRAISFYEQISDVRRDQAMTKSAMESLDLLINRFPDSKYRRDAVLKRDLTLDHLAGKEMEIGRYYLDRGEFNSAINRFKIVIKDYDTTSHTPEALYRLVESFLTLGLRQEALRIAAVLGYNFPGSKWYERAYALMDDQERERLSSERGFLDRTLDSLLRDD